MKSRGNDPTIAQQASQRAPPQVARPRSRGCKEIDAQVGEHHSSQLLLEAAEAKAERIVAEELGRLCWQEMDLVSRRKQDPAKLAIALVSGDAAMRLSLLFNLSDGTV